MHIWNYLHKRSIFVLIESTTTNQQLQLPQQQPIDPLIIAKTKDQTPKPKISNSFEYFQGSITEIQKKYEILYDIVT